MQSYLVAFRYYILADKATQHMCWERFAPLLKNKNS